MNRLPENASEVIAALKQEIERYERLRHAELAWAHVNRVLDGCRDTRDVFYAAFLAMEKHLRAGKYDDAKLVAEFVRERVLMPGDLEGALKDEWAFGTEDASKPSEEPQATPGTRAMRRDTINEVFRRFYWEKK